MKRSIKIIIFTLLLALAVIPFSVGAEEYDGATETEEIYPENEADSASDLAEEATNEEMTENAPNNDESNDDDAVTPEGEDSPFAPVYNFVLEHIGEIFSILSFLGAALIAFLYKKGLLPALQNSLGAMAKMLSGIKETAEIGESVSAELKQEITSRLSDAETSLNCVRGSLDSLTSRLESLAISSDERDRMREILKAQIDMLYEIFLCSSLPEYQKEAVRERMAAMKEVLESESKTDSAN